MTPQSFGTQDELLTYLSMRLMQVPALLEALQEVVPEGYPMSIGRVYISHPSFMDNPDPFALQAYLIGAKITYIPRDGRQEQHGSYMHISSLSDSILERSIAVLGLSLANGIRAHEQAKKPLPIRALTPEDRKELQAWF